MPADQLLLATLPDGRGGVCAAMWAVVESVQRDRRRGPHHKVSIVRLVVKPEHRRGDPQLERRNVKLDLAGDASPRVLNWIAATTSTIDPSGDMQSRARGGDDLRTNSSVSLFVAGVSVKL